MLNPFFHSRVLLWALFFLFFISSLHLSSSHSTFLLSWHIMSISPTHLTFPLLIDQTALMFASIVCLIATNVLHFSQSYMASDPHLPRFTYTLMLFVLSMLLLIFIPHLMVLLLGWDGLGITSFLLVIYYQNPASLAAGMITALVNRIGDSLLLLSIGTLLNQGHWLTNTMFSSPNTSLTAAMITIAAMTKSAQIPFSSWLPAAMAAPTPVSALVHSSTLVTAGVFLLIRFLPQSLIPTTLNPTLLFFATSTMLMAGISAMTECDMKKIIALSTLSQLGLMIATLAMNLPSLALFHLFTHAMFKALLFISAGTLIYHFAHTQDLRKIGNTPTQLPLTSSAALVANLALSGTPFLAAFYSKDMILEMMLFNPSNIIILLSFLLATLLTSAYSTRLTIIMMWIPSNANPLHSLNDEDMNLTTPPLILSFAAIFSGTMLNWVLLPLAPHPTLPGFLKLLPLISTITGTVAAWNLLLISPLFLPAHSPLSHFYLTSMWCLTPILTQLPLPPMLTLSSYTLSGLDATWLELTLFKRMTSITTLLQPIQNNSINKHLLLALTSVLPIMMI